MFRATLSEPYDLVRPRRSDAVPRVSLDEKSRVIIDRVKVFFEELKRRLGEESRGTIFELPTHLTALACGVSRATVYRACSHSDGLTHRPVPRTKQMIQTRKELRKEALRKHGQEWGSVVRHFVHSKLRAEEDVTVDGVWKELSEIHPRFNLSKTTFYHLLKGLRFSYKLNAAQPYIFERPDIVRRRSAYLAAILRARSENHCIVYMDETWVFDGMTKKRGWNDTTIPRFAPAAVMDEFSCGRTAAKNKGRRAIVISALSEEGVVPGTTKVIVSGRRPADDDYHRDMNHEMFENWLRESIPQMRSIASGRCLSLVIDNAPYHSRQLEKIPTRSSSKAAIVDYLRSKGVTVADNSTKENLLLELRDLIASRGGLYALRKYATESICAEYGVTVIRLPPFHCFFNPIEYCWGRLKGHLNKLGKPSDTLETVRTRALEWMSGVPPALCVGWVSHIMKEEAAAREKIAADLNAAAENEGDSSSEESSVDDDDLELGEDD